MRKPWLSTCARILPISPRDTASGLTMNSVRSSANGVSWGRGTECLARYRLRPAVARRALAFERPAARLGIRRIARLGVRALRAPLRLARRVRPEARAPIGRDAGFALAAAGLRRRRERASATSAGIADA